ncbi:MAG: metallophosphoesterase [Candidatus Thorarchaeota archaeon]
MVIKILAISDTHLGEGTSLLMFPHGRQRLLQALHTEFDYEKIEKLILIGDAADTALASVSQVITHTSIFLDSLRSSFDIDKVIYIPGNHDHSVWTDYKNRRYGQNSDHHLTNPGGEQILRDSAIDCDFNDDDCWEACEDLLTIFFEYDFGPAWRKIEDDVRNGKFFNFAIANPVYAVEVAEFERTYVFTHGTHFKSVIAKHRWLKRFIDWTQLDRLIAGIEIDSNCKVSRATDLEDLEREVAPLVDSLYISSRNLEASRSDQLWYLYTVVTSHFAEPRQIDNYDVHETYPDITSPRFRTLDRENESIDLMFRYFFDHLIRYLKDDNGMGTDNITFVYGDTHEGGFGRFPDLNGTDLRVYNLGSWVVRNENDHPPCHVFAVDENGDEHILDISFKDVTVLGEPIIALAAADFENRYRATGWLARLILNLFR